MQCRLLKDFLFKILCNSKSLYFAEDLSFKSSSKIHTCTQFDHNQCEILQRLSIVVYIPSIQ